MYSFKREREEGRALSVTIAGRQAMNRNYYNKSFHIAGYTFRADVYCPDCVCKWAEEELANNGYSSYDIQLMVESNPMSVDIGVHAYRAECLLPYVADLLNHRDNFNINLEDVHTWDSDYFPKVIWFDQIENEERCCECHETL